MNTDAILQYYDDLMRLVVLKCGAQTDAEDLVEDTMLAAFSYRNCEKQTVSRSESDKEGT